ncbi:MAG: hypothetical protein ABI895_14725 [Deltaproteobacteria bacterium]
MQSMACGVELADAAIVPEQLAALMSHVAENLEGHARWVGVETPAAEAEHEGLLRLAADYRGIAAAAQRAAATMRALRDLEPAPHDPAHWDRPAFLHWMRRKIELQRALAQLLCEHAEASEQILTGD